MVEILNKEKSFGRERLLVMEDIRRGKKRIQERINIIVKLADSRRVMPSSL